MKEGAGLVGLEADEQDLLALHGRQCSGRDVELSKHAVGVDLQRVALGLQSKATFKLRTKYRKSS